MFEMVKKGAFVQHIDKELRDLLLDLIILQFVSIKFIRLDGFGEVCVMASSMSSWKKIFIFFYLEGNVNVQVGVATI